MDWDGKGTLTTLTDKQEQHTYIGECQINCLDISLI